MSDPLDIARARNRAIVAKQREVFGDDRHERVGKGLCHVTLKLSEMEARPSDEDIDAAVEDAKRELRQAVNDKGGVLDRFVRVPLVNGDVEVRCFFSVKRGTDA